MTLSIIILSYNTKVLLRQCLQSVFAQDFNQHKFEVIVVDNASHDGSPEMLRREFPECTVILNSQNRGFAAANNQGFAIAQGKFILLLNSDTVLDNPQTLSQLLDFLNRHPQAALVTPKVVLPNGRLDLACHRGLPTPWNAFTYFTQLERLFPHTRLFSGYHQLYQDLSQPHRLGATAATAILVRRAAIEAVGGLDERYFLYGEDLDWCKRFSDAGWEIWFDPTVTVEHHKSASGKKHELDKNAQIAASAHFYDTMKQFYEKHYQDTYPRWLRQLVYLGIAIKRKLPH